MRKLFAIPFLLLFLSSPAFAVRIFYIDQVNGSNANDGTAKTLGGGHGPWKSHPYMQNAAGCGGTPPTYAHTAGDQFIFKGGVTWPGACFPLNISQGGSSNSVRDLYTVDQTWFAGGGFTKPIFVATSGANINVVVVQVSNVTLSYLDIGGQSLNSMSNSTCSNNVIQVASGLSNILASNVALHGWTLTTNHPANYDHGRGGMCSVSFHGGSENNITLDSSEVSDTENNAHGGSVGSCGENINITNSHCHDLLEGIVGHGVIHDSEFNNIGNINGACSALIDCNATHINTIESGNFPGDGDIYNSYIHDVNTFGEVLQQNVGTGSGGVNIYNNVITHAGRTLINIDVDTGGGFSTGTANIWNNTLDGSTSTNGGAPLPCGQFGTGVTVTSKNNICIGQNTSSFGSNIYSMATSEANTYGYITANKFAPTTSDPNTVAKGVNLTSNCGTFPALCSDTEGAPWFGSSYQARPTGSTAWDFGPYKFPAAGTNAPIVTITAPANGATVSGNSVAVTGTCVPVGPATIQANSFQLQVDSVNYGASSSTSPISVNFDTTKASNASHSLFLSCIDSNGLSGGSTTPYNVTVSNSIPGCFISDVPWIGNVSFPAITGSSSTVTWTATPFTASTEDTVMGLSNVVAGAYSDLATIVRFSNNGQIQIYDGGISGYRADNVVTYLAGTAYTFSEVVNLTNHTYSVTETSPSNVVLCASCAFRTSQAGLTQLQYMNGESSGATPNTAKICNVSTAPVIAFSPASQNFGNQTQGTTSSVATITVSNTGGANEVLNTPYFTITGANAADFTNTGGGTCANAGTITPSGSCTVFLTFTPATALAESATLNVNGTASGTVPLSGTGTAVPPPSPQPAPANPLILGLVNSPGAIDLTIGNCPTTCTIHLACGTTCLPAYTGTIQ